MFGFFTQQTIFILSVGAILFLPGFVLLRSVFHRHTFTSFELFVFSVPASIALVNFLIIGLGKSDISITKTSILLSLTLLVVGIIFFTSLFKVNKNDSLQKESTPEKFSKKEGWLIILVIALTIFIKTIYLSQAILPTATDLGHHMYWSKTIVETGHLPTYAEQNIIEKDGAYTLTAPQPIDDFIIGEHLVFAAVALLSGISFISAFPSLVLFLVNVMTVLAVFVFVWRLFSSKQKLSPATLALLFVGPLYALASPQAKFVSGGVVGNTFGNLFIPVVLYTYWRALHEKNSRMLTLAFFLTFGLAYIHHLSTLVFLFIAAFSILVFIAFNLTRIGNYLNQWIKTFLSPAPILFALVAVIFFFFVLAPSYADPKSLNTALGAPSKATRAGLTFLELTSSTGESRMGLGLIGLALLAFFALSPLRNHTKTSARNSTTSSSLASHLFSPDSYATAFVFGWGFALLIMSLRPQWVFLDIPSNRISSYAVFPFAILSALAFSQLMERIKRQGTRDKKNQKQETLLIPRTLGISTFILLFAFFIVGGFYDNSQSLPTKPKAEEAVQTFHASQYLADHRQPHDIILKDHNYITADSWMKLFFMDGYSSPLSRGYFQRYTDTVKPREQCTLNMIAIPNTPKGEKCFNDLGVNTLVVDPHVDSVQFKKAPEFSLIYSSNDISVYIRKNQD